MPTTDLDRLSDEAHAASYLADRTGDLGDHAEAARAHYKAHKAALASKTQSRPSFEGNHLKRAAEHDKIAHDKDSYEQKRLLANNATKKANRTPSGANHRAAAAAHKEAAAAYRSQKMTKKSGAESDPWELRDHDRSQKDHETQADFLDKQGDGGEDTPTLSPQTTGEPGPTKA